ncbi:MAG: hypothetical protein IJH39_10125 [Clostridia bacterium]|nr:hypothetical protein [Clostridia bacterium]
MKKNKKYVIILITTISIIAISFSVYAFFTSEKDENNSIEKNKALSEIQYLESKFLNIFNSLNNIQYENYRIYSNKISEKNNKESQSNSSSNEESSSQENNKDESSIENTQESSPQDNDNLYKYNLELEGVLTNKQNINWDYIKNEIELIYESLPTITLDLYKINLNKKDILEFNSQFDLLAEEVNNENKENALSQLSELYMYLPKFLENTNTDNCYKKIIKTKAFILQAYSILDSGDWNKISSIIDNAINIFNDLIGTEDKNKTKQYSINKCFIMLNELKNSTNQKNKEIFLIKYRNLLEEISNI